MSSLQPLFNARSVAVVGASENPAKFGNIILKNIIDGGYGGNIYPINPRADSILGLTCYKSLSSVPHDIDVAVIVVPAKIVPAVMAEAGEKNVKGALIISGGFREIGNDELENEVVGIAVKHGIRIIGPNCQGFNYTTISYARPGR